MKAFKPRSIFVSNSSKFFCLLIFCLLSLVQLRAQQFGGTPSSIQWRQLNSDTVRVIFPKGWEQAATRIVSIASSLGPTQKELGSHLHKFDVILRTQTNISNGYVMIGPRRSEFYMRPPQDAFELGSLAWSDQLAIHEFRHIQQYNNFNKGGSRFLSLLAGQLGQTLANNTALPNWFWEGDAVLQETEQTLQGRGRLPSFFNGYRSIWASGKNYSWMTLRNGSFRNSIPSHYPLGYMLTSFAKRTYGNNFWQQVTDRAVRFSSPIYPFQAAFRQKAGESFTNFRTKALKIYSDSFDNGKDQLSDWASKQPYFVGDQEFPQWTDKGQLIYLEARYDALPAFVWEDVKSGLKKRLSIRDISFDRQFSLRNNLLVYASAGFDTRWDWKDYSRVCLLNLTTGQQQTLTGNESWFSPDVSEDGTKLLAVNADEEGRFRLYSWPLTDSATKLIYATEPDWVISFPKFYPGGAVAAVRNANGKMGIAAFTENGQLSNWILPFSNCVLSHLQTNADTLSFSASHGNRDELYFYAKNRFFKILTDTINRNAGNYQPAIKNGQLAWSGFSAVGQRMLTLSLNASNCQEITTSYFNAPMQQLGLSTIAERLPIPPTAEEKQPEAYSSLHSLFNFHSALPDFNDPVYTYSLVSDNVLNTLQSDVSYTYNRNEGSSKLGADLLYGGLYPWFRLGSSYTFNRNALRFGNTVRWKEMQQTLGLQLPLNLSSGKKFNYLNLSTNYHYTKRYFEGKYVDSFDRRGFDYWSNSISFSSQSQRALQHIFPKWAQSLRLENSLAGSRIKGWQWMATGSFYFPGLFKNNHLVILLATQARDSLRRISFANNFPFSRGYQAVSFYRMNRMGMNYHFPLAYPDWGFGNLVYFLRIRANLFYDITRIQEFNSNKKMVQLSYRSAGTELFFDTKWWNQQPVSFGFRYSRLFDAANQGTSANQWEFVLPVNLIAR